MNFDSIKTQIETLGPPKIPSPLHRLSTDAHKRIFVSDAERIIIDVSTQNLSMHIKSGREIPSFELSGARSQIYFDPSKLRCALVTCGGLCPGLNDIIRSIVLELYYGYNVRGIYGIRFGLEGFIPKYGHEMIGLKAESVLNILEMGGSILGSSRGHQPIDDIVDSLERMNIGILFMIGGGGTLIAASKIADVISQRNLKISVIGIPKTIDSDIFLVSRSFGFDTAVDVASQVIKGAHNEATGYPKGIGLIKLMGRHSGFIAATAALAQQDANFVLIPEVDFDLEGTQGLFAALEKRLRERNHSVIIVAEGAGQKFFPVVDQEVDKSGNIKLGDIGLFLKKEILAHFKSQQIEISLKYIDPSYLIRSLPANANDHVFCSFLGRDAVHAGMAGKTKCLVGYWNSHYVQLPMQATAGRRKQVDPEGKLWRSVLEATGQGSLKNNS